LTGPYPLWGEEKRIVTGSYILGCLLRGIIVECELTSGCELPVPLSKPGVVKWRSLRRGKSKESEEEKKE
jgi:hypothetical protein